MLLKWLFEDPYTIMNGRFRLFDENDLDGGAGSSGGETIGEGSEDDPSSGGSGDQGGGSGELGQRDPGAQGRRQPQSQMIPYHRFQQVNNGYKAYRGFGTPAELKAKLDRLAYLEKNPVNRYTPEQESEIREDMLRLFPQLRSLEQNDSIQKQNFVAYGSRQNSEFAKQLGIEANENNNQIIEDLLGGVISRNPELRQRFFARDSSVFADAFKVVKPILAAKTRTVPGLGAIKNKTVAKPGESKKSGESKPNDNAPKPGSPLFEREVLDEASERAFDLITSREE